MTRATFERLGAGPSRPGRRPGRGPGAGSGGSDRKGPGGRNGRGPQGFVFRARAAGVVVLGKANLSEWANFRSTRSSSGWSSRGGQTRNPYALDRSPCGSSAGTGSAIAASTTMIGLTSATRSAAPSPISA